MNIKTKLYSVLAAAAIATSTTAVAEGPSVSGSVSFDVNTHFVSSGSDVWAAGDDA